MYRSNDTSSIPLTQQTAVKYTTIYHIQMFARHSYCTLGYELRVWPNRHAIIRCTSHGKRAKQSKGQLPASVKNTYVFRCVNIATPLRFRSSSIRVLAWQTVGLQNDKVSYRNYRQAARSIFTLIRAFCPSEGESRSKASIYSYYSHVSLSISSALQCTALLLVVMSYTLLGL